MSQTLRDFQGDAIWIRDLTDARLASDQLIRQQIDDLRDVPTAKQLQMLMTHRTGFEVAEIEQVSEELGFRSRIVWPRSDQAFKMDVLFTRNTVQGKKIACHEKKNGKHPRQPWSVFANNPTWGVTSLRMAKELRSSAMNDLPAYMVPQTIIVLPEMPRTPNGKVNRAALPVMTSPLARSRREIIPPTHETEKKLLDLWQELLQVSPLSIRDNFFDIGGSSILATRLLVSLNQMLGQDIPLRTLIENPTIEELTLVIASDPKMPDRSLDRYSQAWNRRYFFLVHGVDGSVLWAVEFARLLQTSRSVIGIQAVGLEGSDSPLRKMNELVAHVVREIKEIQPRGPYSIAGYCFGGMVAYEVARHLVAAGDEVQFLGMIDVPFPVESVSIQGREEGLEREGLADRPTTSRGSRP